MTPADPGPVSLRPGQRVIDRHDGQLQVGCHLGRRVLVPATPPTRALLDRLATGVEVRPTDPAEQAVLSALAAADLLVQTSVASSLARRRDEATVGIWAPPLWERQAARLLEEHGVGVAQDRDADLWLVGSDGETPRADVDDLIRRDRPHLLVAAVAGQLRIGPFVQPGSTACLYCVDAHGADEDPAHLLVTRAHRGESHPDPALVALALAWAVRDITTYVEGREPATWSTRVEVAADLTMRRTTYERHPRCGCAWAELAVG